MYTKINFLRFLAISILVLFNSCSKKTSEQQWTVTSQQYLEKPGLVVLAFHDFYPTGRQGGIEIIQHGARIASNGFLTMERVNGKPTITFRHYGPDGKVYNEDRW